MGRKSNSKNWKKILIEKSIENNIKILTKLENKIYPRETKINFICSTLNCEETHIRNIRYISRQIYN